MLHTQTIGTAATGVSRSTHDGRRCADGQFMLHATLNDSNEFEVFDDRFSRFGRTQTLELGIEHGGYRLQFPEADYLADEIIRRGVPYEYPLLVFLAEVLDCDAVVVDVGANVGNHGVYLAINAGVRVHAFEPSDESLEHLRANVRSNGLSELITIHDVALGKYRGLAHVSERPSGNLGGTRIQTGSGPIRVARLDDFAFDRVDLVKIDVEGAELNVIAGGGITLLEHRPLVVAEAHDRTALDALDSALGELGYMRWGRNLSPLCTPTYLYAPSRRSLATAIARNVPRVVRNRMRKLLAQLSRERDRA